MKGTSFTLVGSLLLMLLVVQATGAATLSFQSSIPLSMMDWAKQVDIQQFDPALGSLESVELCLRAHIEGAAFFENRGPTPADVTTRLSAELKLINGELIAVALPVHAVVDHVEAFDGILDFSGTSGKTYDNLVADDNGSMQSTDPEFLSIFTGTETTHLSVVTRGQSSISGPGNLAAGFRAKAQADVIVTYTYTPAPGAIGGQIWIDGDSDGEFEPEIGELGVNGVQVNLYDENGNLAAGTVTSNDPNTEEAGWYFFDNRQPGSYTVVIADGSFQAGSELHGCAQTYDYDMILDNQTFYPLASRDTFLEADFGYRPQIQPGTGTPGYWKNHASAWPVESIAVGGVTYSRDEAIAIMSKPDGDKTQTMFRSLVCAMLNVGIGNDSTCIDDVLLTAQDWMATYGPAGSKVKANSYAWRIGEPLYTVLDEYNNGMLCAPHRD